MGKLLILSITDGEEQLLDKLKDFLAEAPGIEIVEPPATKHTLTFPGLELHLRKQTVKWRAAPCTSRIWSSLRWPTWPGALAGSSRRNRSTRPYGTSSRSIAARPWPTSSASSAEDGAGQPIRTVPHSGYKFELLHTEKPFPKKRSYPLWVTAFFYLSQDHNSPPLSQKSVQTEHNRLYGADRTISFR